VGDVLTQHILAGGLQVSAKFDSLLQLPAGPLSQQASTPPLSGFTPWYYSAALAMAYQTADNTLWNKTPPTWTQTFGPGGTLLRICSGLMLADGIELRISSPAVLDTQQQKALRSVAKRGMWPFFVPPTNGWTVAVSFDGEGRPTLTLACAAGNPQLLARVVAPIQRALGLSS
jgi:hypothetical protein